MTSSLPFRHQRRRAPALTAGLLAFAFTLSACAPSAGPTEPTPAPAEAPVAAPATATPADTGVFSGLVTPALLTVDLDTVQADLFDQGKMWTFEFPPREHFAREYGFEPGDDWFERARLSALRIVGCSASFVSPHGLVMTNHHCAREQVVEVSRDGENLLDDGFYARSLAEERPVAEDFHADQLIALVDVTERVETRLAALTEEERAQQRQQVLDEVGEAVAQEYGGEEADIVVEVISLWNGGYYSAYVFRRYENVKLVMAPELQIGFFGGDPDNFTYPRFNLDYAFMRVYGDDGEPISSEHYFQWDDDGAQPGEPIFIIGNPGSTSRLQAVTELEFRRDVSDRSVLQFIRDRVDVLQEFAEANPEEAEEMDLINTIFSLENSEKAYEGRLGGLEDVEILARRLKLQEAFRDSILADPALEAEYGDIFEELGELQARKREVAPAFGSFLALTAEGFSSATLRRALLAYQLLNARQGGAPEAQIEQLTNRIEAVPTQPAALDRALMTARLRDFVANYGEDEAWVQSILQGRTPEAAAEAIHAGSALADSAAAVAALAGLTMDDPAVQVVSAYIQPFGQFQQVMAQVSAREEELAARLGRARLAVYGQAVPPDATFSLRLADGVVQSYEYNGTIAPTHTTFYGLYGHYHAYARMYEDPAESPWHLPERWQTPPAGLDLETPLNFVSTADIIGGNSGSPVVDRDLDVVGLVFDGNIESLPGDYIYLPELNRSVSVDVRGMLESLEAVYDMDRLVTELTTGELVR